MLSSSSDPEDNEANAIVNWDVKLMQERVKNIKRPSGKIVDELEKTIKIDYSVNRKHSRLFAKRLHLIKQKGILCATSAQIPADTLNVFSGSR